MRTTIKLLTFIKGFQVLKHSASIDHRGIQSIGYGTIQYPTGGFVLGGQQCTESQAEYWLKYQIGKAEVCLNNAMSEYAEKHGVVKLSQNQFDMLCSFVVSEGFDAFIRTSFARKVFANPYDETIFSYNKMAKPRSCEFLNYVYADGKIKRELINRRVAEADGYKK